MNLDIYVGTSNLRFKYDIHKPSHTARPLTIARVPPHKVLNTFNLSEVDNSPPPRCSLQPGYNGSGIPLCGVTLGYYAAPIVYRGFC